MQGENTPLPDLEGIQFHQNNSLHINPNQIPKSEEKLEHQQDNSDVCSEFLFVGINPWVIELALYLNYQDSTS